MYNPHANPSDKKDMRTYSYINHGGGGGLTWWRRRNDMVEGED
jgi:hypothetical protein